MKQAKLISYFTLVVAIIMLSTGLVMESTNHLKITEEALNMKNAVASALEVKKGNEEETKISELSTNIEMETAPAIYLKIEKVFSEISLDEAVNALNEGSLKMEYSARYTNGGLTKRRGTLNFNGHKETFYSEKVLPGNGLRIPGRHVADDGTIRDEEGYICVAADPGFMSKGSILITSLGPAKVYDCGCAYGTVDIYVNW